MLGANKINSVKAMLTRCNHLCLNKNLSMLRIAVFSKRYFASKYKNKLFINGKWEKSSSGSTFGVLNPHTEEIISEVHEANKEDVDRAVSSARNAFDNGPWRKFSAQQRAECLFKLADLIEKNREELYLLESLNNGKTSFIANIVDLNGTVAIYRYFASLADKITGDTIPAHGNYFAYTRREPVGVAGLIIPWNFPIMMQAMKLAPALAAGCTAVMKSAEQTPLTALRVAELTKEAGIPNGVYNLLNGHGATTGKYLVAHPGVDKISFTGSTKVGLEILQNSSQSNLKRVSLELGGKSPFIICDDFNIDAAVRFAHSGLFFNAGQVCFAGSRVLVHERIYDEFIEKSVAYAKRIKTGDQLAPDTTQGPLVSKRQLERVLEYVDSGVKEGAKLMTGGKRVGSKGFHIEPTIFSNVQDHMKIAKEEIFGPVMSVFKFSDVDEAIRRANDTPYGLAAGVCTNSIDKAIYISNSLRAGQVYINNYGQAQIGFSFGGFKNSGIGRELGTHGMDMYLEDKTVIIAKPEGSLP